MSFLKNGLAAATLCAGLSACYVIPIDQYPPAAYNANQGVAIVPAPMVRPVYTARLYPANDPASRYGMVSGIITNPETGHGQFSFTMNGESFTGEATRLPSSSKGVANAAGNRGGYARCQYTMSSAAQGSGVCTFSNEARYDMHITQ